MSCRTHSFVIGMVFLTLNLFSQELDSLKSSNDSIPSIKINDTTAHPQDSISVKSLTSSNEKTEKKRKIRIVRRDFRYRTQMGSAIFMMSFVALILITVENWNPN